MPASLTAERLRQVLSYDRKTGVFRWRLRLSKSIHVGDVAGSPHGAGYIRIRIDRSEYLAHRLAWLHVKGLWPTHQIDHRNLQKTDNSFDNLREATNIENHRNMGRRKNNRSGYKGVYPSRSGKFFSQIRIGKKTTHLGTFDTPEGAHAAYVLESEKHFGEFARAA